jgi:hypothetical protein
MKFQATINVIRDQNSKNVYIKVIIYIFLKLKLKLNKETRENSPPSQK